MPTSVNAGGRLDRLPIGPFHYRIMTLIGIGMFFDGFDIYIAGTVLGVTLKSGFSTLAENALFISATFFGMMLGSFGTGFLGDRFGRRFSYQFNLLLFGLASLAAAFAPNMTILILCRFVMGLGLGAENVVGYSTMTEFVPARSRGKYLGLMAVCVVSGLPVALLVASFVVPMFGWRAMFVLGGIGALVVWYMRKNLPESPRWLEAVGRREEAEALMQKIESEAAQGKPLPPVTTVPTVQASGQLSSLFAPPLLSRMIVGSVCLITINTLLYGFVTWLPVFFIKQGLSVATSFSYSLLMALGAPVGSAIGALTADRWGRKPTIIGSSLIAVVLGIIYPMISDPLLLPAVGFALTIPIYVLVALLFGIYIPELFPTEVRLRASGIVNTLGRGATIVTPFLVVTLFEARGVAGVMALMIGLLILQIITVWALGIEPRNRSLEEMKPDEAAVPVLKEVS
ncbi:MFS transporter, putative metabolite:H+ symporter [Bradyrhizobium sp. NFR13]|jgi:putative MFS transporter|uniref:MFS transporter n=1 Tax=Bradyrhizobium sp. NFR13 TaxID=1566285 RepID=UPI0008F0447E|nr:MFS transporter [Bradyrhizobium sp. NFR13]SFL40183.1 MFS transporter, putative metabolite:H+ symporter [Bradyrhizobium sp. NFR13]